MSRTVSLSHHCTFYSSSYSMHVNSSQKKKIRAGGRTTHNNKTSIFRTQKTLQLPDALLRSSENPENRFFRAEYVSTQNTAGRIFQRRGGSSEHCARIDVCRTMYYNLYVQRERVPRKFAGSRDVWSGLGSTAEQCNSIVSLSTISREGCTYTSYTILCKNDEDVFCSSSESTIV